MEAPADDRSRALDRIAIDRGGAHASIVLSPAHRNRLISREAHRADPLHHDVGARGDNCGWACRLALPTEAAVVPTGQGLCGAIVRGRSLWLGVYGTGQVLQIDPTGRVRTRIEIGRSACRLAIGPSGLWVTRDRAAEVVRVTPGTGRRVSVGPTPFDVLLAAGSLWVSSYDSATLARLDPRTGRRLATVWDEPNPADVRRYDP